ncbi:MAG: phosphoglucosamine mutase [Candidatus Diapherotrites archaeon]|nr:phosphoglucosamine mutase [Candidatus Diapherotrites archaeon]
MGEYPILPEVVLRVSKATALFFKDKTDKVCIGTDTRKSSPLLAEIVSEGFGSAGFSSKIFGILPTPGIAFYARKLKSVGIVISASHNPAEYNGIKFFSPDGYKLNDAAQAKIESIFNSLERSETHSQNLNVAYSKSKENTAFANDYVDFLCSSIEFELKRITPLIDCANGAASTLIPLLTKKLFSNAKIINNRPNGENINKECGATNPNALISAIKRTSVSFGVAFDGDADRAVFCDEKGNLINGNNLIALLALWLKEKNQLRKNKIVITEMSNIALKEFLKENNIKYITTEVGDRFVLEAVKENNLSFGAEPNGHALFADLTTTDDGILLMLKVAEILAESGKKLSKIADILELWPEKLINIPIKEKKPLDSLYNLQNTVEKAKADGCFVLLRYSGTEPLLRIFMQAENNELIDMYASLLEEAAKKDFSD